MIFQVALWLRLFQTGGLRCGSQGVKADDQFIARQADLELRVRWHAEAQVT